MKQQIFNFDSGNNIFFTSDTHFGHENIIRFCQRPFSSVEEMDQKLIENWNKVVGPNDYIFHLGDFCFKGSQYWDRILDQLNGHKILVIGNHDVKNLRDGSMMKFNAVGFQFYINVGGRSIILNHNPFLCYGGSYKDIDNATFNLFGHVHLNPYTTDGKDYSRMQTNIFWNQYDVGVDANNFTPISFDEINNKLQNYYKNQTNQVVELQK